jgi:hypothetical protein
MNEKAILITLINMMMMISMIMMMIIIMINDTDDNDNDFYLNILQQKGYLNLLNTSFFNCSKSSV